MKDMKSIFFQRVLPLLILITGIFYIFVENTMLFKLIPMALIIIYAVYRLPKKQKRYHLLAIIGLLFCMLGDWSLQWFVIGLTSFLIGHLFYIFSFRLRRKRKTPNHAITIILIIYGVIIGGKLLVSLEESTLIVPVVVYMLAISYMVWVAWHTGHSFVMAGSILFLVSDSILAWNKFVGPIEGAGIMIMLTYYAAQFCIAHSLKE